MLADVASLLLDLLSSIFIIYTYSKKNDLQDVESTMIIHGDTKELYLPNIACKLQLIDTFGLMHTTIESLTITTLLC